METKGDVSDALAILLELQIVDSRLREQQRSLANMTLTVGDKNKRVKEVEESVQKERETLKRLEMDSAKRELEIRSHQDKVGKLRAQLNMVKNQKEYDALIHEITASQTDSSKAEDDALAMMSSVDDVKKSLEALAKDLVTAKEEVADEQRTADAEVRKLSVEMRQLKAEREALKGRLEPEIYKKYQRILVNKGERAVAEVVQNTCNGCNMGVTKQSLSRLMARREIIQCPNCMRILYLKPQEDGEEQ